MSTQQTTILQTITVETFINILKMYTDRFISFKIDGEYLSNDGDIIFYKYEENLIIEINSIESSIKKDMYIHIKLECIDTISMDVSDTINILKVYNKKDKLLFKNNNKKCIISLYIEDQELSIDFITIKED